MRGLFVISSFSEGGSQRVLSNLLMGLPEDWEIDLLLNDNSSQDYPLKGKIISLGLREEKNKKKILYQLKVLIYRYRKLKKLKETGQYDFCASFMDSANLANILTAYPGTKTVLSEHTYLSEACAHSATYKYLVRPVVRRFYNQADTIIAVSQEMKEDLVRNFNVDSKRCHVVYNGIIRYTGERPKRQDKEFIITTMGRLVELKGQWHLIRVAAALVPQYPQLRLVILGEGSLRNKLEELAVKLGIKDQVSLPGFVHRPLDVIASSDLFAFPSHYEGFGMALVEAMSCGVPVISSDYHAGAREILAPDTDCGKKIQEGIQWAKYGILIPVSKAPLDCEITKPMDAGEISLCQAIEKMIIDEALRKEYGEKAAFRAASFSTDKMVQDWIKELCQVYEEKT